PNDSLVFASCVPAISSGVSVGITDSSFASELMRFLSCHRQSAHSTADTSFQKPRPAEWNSFSFNNCGPGSSSSAPEHASCICGRNIGLDDGVSSDPSFYRVCNAFRALLR